METTREKAKEKNHKDLVNNLQGLLEKNYDAEKGFTKAMEGAKDGNLKHFLQQQARQRSKFANELDHELRSLDEKPNESGSATGGLHRAWMDVKTTFTGNDDEAVLEECIRGEKASMEAYQETLKESHFPTNVHTVLNNQLSEIKGTVSKVKNLEDLAENMN